MERQEVWVGHPTPAALRRVIQVILRRRDVEADVGWGWGLEVGWHNFIPSLSDADSDESDDGGEEGTEANVVVVNDIAFLNILEELESEGSIDKKNPPEELDDGFALGEDVDDWVEIGFAPGILHQY